MLNPRQDPSAADNEPAAHPLPPASHVAAEEYEIHIDHHPGYLAARVSGDLPIELFLSTLHVLGIESDGGGEDGMLVDLRSLATAYSPNELVRVGREVATSFAHMDRMALLVLPKQVTGISERAARKAGLNMCVFDAEGDAVGWVREARS